MRKALKKKYIYLKYLGVQLWKTIKVFLGKGLLIISLLFFLIAFFTNVTRRAPILSFFIKELELPIVYNLSGTIEIKDENQNLMSISDIYIAIGGYQECIENGEEYSIRFSATESENIPVVIKYSIRGNRREKLVYVTYDKREETKHKNFYYIE